MIDKKEALVLLSIVVAVLVIPIIVLLHDVFDRDIGKEDIIEDYFENKECIWEIAEYISAYPHSKNEYIKIRYDKSINSIDVLLIEDNIGINIITDSFDHTILDAITTIVKKTDIFFIEDEDDGGNGIIFRYDSIVYQYSPGIIITKDDNEPDCLFPGGGTDIKELEKIEDRVYYFVGE